MGIGDQWQALFHMFILHMFCFAATYFGALYALLTMHSLAALILQDEVDVLDPMGADADDDGDDELFAAAKKPTASRKDRKNTKAEDMIKKELGEAPTKKNAAVKKEEGSGDEDEDVAAAPSGPRVLGLSKKEGALRRRELLGSGPSSLAAALTALVSERAGPLLRSPHGSEVVIEVARGGDGGAGRGGRGEN